MSIRPSAQDLFGNREFIIIGQDTGVGYCLWEVAPAPLDPVKRAVALEEIEYDTYDAYGSVHTEFAPSAGVAVNQLVAALRERSGSESYGLTPDSQLDSYLDAAPPPVAEPYGRAYSRAATARTTYRVKASSVPGRSRFNVDGLPLRRFSHETRDRVRAAIVNSGLGWPAANILVNLTPEDIHVTNDSGAGASGLDLPIAVSLLTAIGHVSSSSLVGVTPIGELGLDGGLRAPSSLGSSMAAASVSGATTVIVPPDAVPSVHGLRIITAASLTEAVGLLAAHRHHPEGCAHCGDEAPAHEPCTPQALCPSCRD